MRQARESRQLVFDYALGISIIGLIPIAGFLTLKLLVAFGLLAKMTWDIGAKWKFAQGQDVLALTGHLFGFLGAIVLACMAWLTFWVIGLFIPFVGSLRQAAALFTLTWMLGQTTNQYYASGRRTLTRRV